MSDEPNVSAKSTSELVRLVAGTEKRIQKLARLAGMAEMELTQRIEASGGYAIADPDFDVELAPGRVSYDQGRLRPALEVEGIPAEEMVGEGKAYREPWTETVEHEGKFNVQQLQKLARKYGGRLPEIIEAATVPGRRRLVVKAKEKVPA